MRLYQTVGAVTTRFAYDGLDAIAEYNGSNALQRRFVFDPTTGQPVVWYEGTGTAATNRRYLSTDERGSVISVSDSTALSLGINTYDEFGKPGAANQGRFQYTGQMYLPETGAYHFPFRDYMAADGIFAQTDPIVYYDSPNSYQYVGNDPVNYIDPLGLTAAPPPAPSQDPIEVVGRLRFWDFSNSSVTGAGPGGGRLSPCSDCIMVIGHPTFPAVPLPLQPSDCTLCNASVAGDLLVGLVITGRRIPSEPFVVRGGRYVYSGYQKPAWSNAFDYAFSAIALAPAAVVVGFEGGLIATESESVGFANYGKGMKWQIRLFKNAIKIRRDVNKPNDHLNVEIGSFNWHIPTW
jgi:RHS repeat-associated protein